MSSFATLPAAERRLLVEQVAARQGVVPVLLVGKMEVLTQLEVIKLKVAAKASAQRLAEGIRDTVVKGLFSLI